MPTQDERLETVEYGLRQFKTETIKAYQDMAMELIIIKGLGEDTIKRLSQLTFMVEQRFDKVESHLEVLQSDTHSIKQDVRGMKQDMQEVKTMLAQLVKNSQK